jgi:hypothetical protein
MAFAKMNKGENKNTFQPNKAENPIEWKILLIK